jgi:hypothetical protein
MARERSGWITYSWIIFMLAGFVNMMFGAAALVRKEYFPQEGVLYDVLQSHGWIWLLVGVMQLVVSFAIANRSQFGLMAGVVLAGLSAVIWFFYMLYLPMAGFALIILYSLVIYGLTTRAEEFGVSRSSERSVT